MRLLLTLLLLVAAAAHAQFNVTVTLPRSSFLALEGIAASVAITNRTGAEAVLGGPGRASWLSFQMTDSQGRILSPIDVSGADLVQIPPGSSIQRSVLVTDAFAPSELGNYALTARVLHTPSGQYYSSNRVIFNITDAKPVWEQPFGVPTGMKDAGRARKYSLSIFHDINETSLYFRLIDDASGLRLQTYRLGPINLVQDPQFTVDQQNNLQVLFLARPHTYVHCLIAPDGSLKKRGYYRDPDGKRPRLAQAADSSVKIIGGEYFDPAAPAPKSPKSTGRNVSDRPPGL